MQVKLLPQDGELYVFAQSLDRVAKERSMRRRQLKGLWARLKDLRRMSVNLTRDELLIKLGQAKAKGQSQVADRVASGPSRCRRQARRVRYALDRKKLRQARRREGRYLLTHKVPPPRATRERCGTIICSSVRWRKVFEPEGHLAIRPIHTQEPERIEAHHLHRLSRLLPARHHRSSPEGTGAGPDPAQPVREVRRRSDDRRAHPDHRRS